MAILDHCYKLVIPSCRSLSPKHPETCNTGAKDKPIHLNPNENRAIYGKYIYISSVCPLPPGVRCMLRSCYFSYAQAPRFRCP
jgi:hypothetical protein